MKICPTCQQTYTDDGLNFCLNDGAILSLMSGQNAPPPTVLMNPPRPTNQPNPFGNQTNEQVTWNRQAQSAAQPTKKSSKTWLWAIGILGLVSLLCGGGAVGLLAIAGMSDGGGNTANKFTANYKVPVNDAPNRTISGETNSVSGSRTDVQTIDLEKWVTDSSTYGTTEFINGELTMGAKTKGFYYVLVASELYKTENATTKVIVKNRDQMPSTLGYGLVFHSNPQPLQQDYAFLIDALRKKYRIVYHVPQKENTVVNWTNSDAIKDGPQANLLEVRDADGSMAFYINGVKVTTVANSKGYDGGVAGLYAGDGAKISFSKLEIDK